MATYNTAGSFDNLIKQLETQAAAANTANEKRYQQATAIYDEIIARYQPGGGFMKGAEALLSREKTKDVATGAQSLVSSGLYGTTTTAGLGKKWEEEVGAPRRLAMEDIMMERLSSAQIGKTGIIERREDIGPSLTDIYNIGRESGGGSGGGGGPAPRYSSTVTVGTPGVKGLGFQQGGTAYRERQASAEAQRRAAQDERNRKAKEEAAARAGRIAEKQKGYKPPTGEGAAMAAGGGDEYSRYVSVARAHRQQTWGKTRTNMWQAQYRGFKKKGWA